MFWIFARAFAAYTLMFWSTYFILETHYVQHLVRDCTRFGKRDAIPNEVMCMRAKALKAQTTSASRTSVSPKYTVRSGWMINSDTCMYNTRKHTLTHTRQRALIMYVFDDIKPISNEFFHTCFMGAIQLELFKFACKKNDNICKENRIMDTTMCSFFHSQRAHCISLRI